MTALVFALGLVLLLGGAELLVGSSSRLARAAGVSPLVVGLTVVAFGTSAPELAVSVRGALAGNSDVAVGNVVGSNVSNVLLILGASALVAPLVVKDRLLWIDVPLMIAASVATLLLALDGQLGRFDGALLFAGIVVYVGVTVRQSRRARAAVRKEYAEAMPDRPPPRAGPLVVQVGLLVLGLLLLVAGADRLVHAATAMAVALGLSDLVISLTVIAVGTSLPELATSIVAAARGERDIAVGNVVGSNLFNLLCVLGVTALVAPEGVAIAPSALRFDLPVMVAVAVACMPVFFAGHRIARWEGAVFLGYYGVYVAYLVLAATGRSEAGLLAAAVGYFALPLTVLTIAVVVYRALRRRRTEPSRS